MFTLLLLIIFSSSIHASCSDGSMMMFTATSKDKLPVIVQWPMSTPNIVIETNATLRWQWFAIPSFSSPNETLLYLKHIPRAITIDESHPHRMKTPEALVHETQQVTISYLGNQCTFTYKTSQLSLPIVAATTTTITSSSVLFFLASLAGLVLGSMIVSMFDKLISMAAQKQK